MTEKLEKQINLIQWALIEFMSLSQQYMPPAGIDAVHAIGLEINKGLDEISKGK